MIRRRRKAVTRSARAAALRSTALATSLALAVGLVRALPADAWAKPKVPLPKPRPIAAQRRSQDDAANTAANATATAAAPIAAAATVAAARPRLHRRRRRWRPRRASTPRLPPPRKPRGAGGGRRDVLDLAGRQGRAGKRHRARAQAQAGRCDAGAGRDIGSGRPQARRMADPAQRRQRRLGRALSRLHRRPIRAGRRRPSCAGASKPRCGTTIATTPRCWSWFENESPISAKGKFALARAMIARGDRANAERLVREAWRNDRHVGRHREHARSTCSARC